MKVSETPVVSAYLSWEETIPLINYLSARTIRQVSIGIWVCLINLPVISITL